MSASVKTIAIVGVTGYARVHLHVCLEQQKAGRVRLRAAVVVNPAEASAELEMLRAVGCAVYDSVDAMWAEQAGKIDLCMLPVPISLHAPMSVAALRAGADVLVEKPLAATVQEVHAMMDAERETGRFIAVSFQDVYSPEVIAVKKAIVDGAIGRLRSIRCHGLWPRPPSYYQRNGWAGRLRIGENWVLDSPVSNAMAHFLNLSLFLGGEGHWQVADPSVVEADLYRVKDIPNFDTAAMRVTCVNGVEIFFAVSHASEERIQPALRIEGSAGYVEWTFCKPFRLVSSEGEEKSYAFTDYSIVRSSMIKRVLDRIDDPSVKVFTPAMALAHVSVVNALYESADIHDVAAEWVETGDVNGEPSRCLRGLPPAIRQASAEGKLFRELQLPWATGTGAPVSLSNYSHFAGGRLGDPVGARD